MTERTKKNLANLNTVTCGDYTLDNPAKVSRWGVQWMGYLGWMHHTWGAAAVQTTTTTTTKKRWWWSSLQRHAKRIINEAPFFLFVYVFRALSRCVSKIRRKKFDNWTRKSGLIIALIAMKVDKRRCPAVARLVLQIGSCQKVTLTLQVERLLWYFPIISVYRIILYVSVSLNIRNNAIEKRTVPWKR